MFTHLTVDQAALIISIRKDAVVKFCGLDQNELPVIQFRDARRTTDEFAIPRRTGRKGAVLPQYPLRWFTDEEVDVINPESHEILTTLYMELP